MAWSCRRSGSSSKIQLMAECPGDNSGSDDDYFDPSPLPVKRRRLTRNEAADIGNTASIEELARGRFESKKTGRCASPNTAQKRRRLVHVHVDDEDLEDTFQSQLPALDSSPWRVRGARWKKPSPPKANDFRSDVVENVLQVQSPNASRHGDNEGPSNDFLTKNNPNLSPHQNDMPPNHTKLPEESITGFDIDKELADLPSDAFDSLSPSPPQSPTFKTRPQQNVLAAPKKNLQQTTLFGISHRDNGSTTSNKVHNWPLASRDEPLTHHKLDAESLKTYVYPTNLGSIRDYQYSIVKRGLYHNLLVALPTGLGKTFIAATIMLNWYRWTKDAQVVFVAPTKPLVAQQVEACFRIAGIPRSQTTMLTGGISPGLRAEEWSSKRVFFMTPQTIINDLKTGICDPKRIVLLVVDEAHRATGSYAYVEVVKFIRRFNQSFRVLALTATPGNSVETVQEVIDGLDISRIEIRTEFSIDIRQYVHNRNIEQLLFENSEEMELVMNLFSKALQPVLNKLRSFNAFWSADPMQLSAYALTQSRQRWFASPAGRNANAAIKGMVHRMFAVLASLAHNIELLKFHGIGPFYHNLVAFQNDTDSKANAKYEKEIADSQSFREMMRKIGFWVNHADFIGHPKLDYLQGVILDHFTAAGEGSGAANGEPPSSTRIMVFVHYRDSAEEVVRVLKRHEPMVRPHVFVGQAASKGSEGMDQKRQLEVIEKFKSGTFNTLVATSIGEEGLDIGEIDLIICYDSSSSPIRMLQRMGRTGRKRAGNIILLLMKGKEESSFLKAKDNYEKMQQMIADAKRFNFHDDRSRRIIPKNVEPVVDRRIVEIPVENTQTDVLPEPKKRGRKPKRPPKKFHMPDGVRTGFINASRLNDDENDIDDSETEHNYKKKVCGRKETPKTSLEPIPPLSSVLLTTVEKKELETRYQDIQATEDEDVVISMPNLMAHPEHQVNLAPIKSIPHGLKTIGTVGALRAMRSLDAQRLEQFTRHAQCIDLDGLAQNSRIISSKKVLEHRKIKPQVQTKRNGKTIPSARRKRALPPSSPPNITNLAAAQGTTSSPPATDPRLRIQSQAISLGDDTSGEDEEEGEPSSELRNFVVEDESDKEELSSVPTSDSESDAEMDNGQKRRKPQLIEPNDSDDAMDSSLPDLQSILKNESRPRDFEAQGPARRRKRQIIEDSSSD